ncbi:MAG: 3-oxoacyl-ACP reductase [Solirubrobacterales bacterium]|nr:3-oxoacyl-ACP reductase [Solirubrobacterales bacterium]
MTDRYSQLVNNPLGRVVAKNVGLPQPVELERFSPGDPVISGPVVVGAAPGGRLGDVLRAWEDAGEQPKALVFDATGIGSSAELVELYRFFHPRIRELAVSGRVVVLGTPPDDAGGVGAATAQRALEGFTRSVGKEVRRGATSQLVYVAPGAEDAIDSTLRFLLSPKSAYVSGQVVRIGRPKTLPVVDWQQPLARTVALVTGAARGIGKAIAETMTRDGAHVVTLDVAGDVELELDITSGDAPARVAEHLTDRHGGVDIVVHNAGVTRDKTLGRMTEDLWSGLMDINLSSAERIDERLLDGVLRENGRIVGVSSISGIAGNAGQANYATSKAGVIGRVRALAPILAERGATINAVAPGFIETKMTAEMPFATREAGRRMNSMAQGGLPIDVAETVAWFASPGSGGVNGNVVRVCGQSLLGA